MSIIRTYPLKHLINQKKQEKILVLFKEYQNLAVKIANSQWQNFFQNKQFNKNLNIKHINTILSERYKQTNQYQVVGQLESFISNRQNDFKDMIYKSSLLEETKKDLYIINKSQSWYNNSCIMLSNIKTKEYRTIPLNTIKLARKIFNHLLKINRKPNLKEINLALDSKVASISKKGNNKTKKDNKAKKFDYWVSLSTLIPRKTIKLPLLTNQFFDRQDGKIKNFIQINKDKNTNQISICLMKELLSKKEEYKLKRLTNKKYEETISIDLGLRNLFATNKGDLIGRNFIDKLYKYDKYLTKLQSELQKHKIKPNSNKRYRKLVKKIRSFIKNEINRGINKIIKLYNPKEIILERLNFQSPKLSKRLNRLISKFGKGFITKKFDSLKELYDINIIEINPAYTSQECNSVGQLCWSRNIVAI